MRPNSLSSHFLTSSSSVFNLFKIALLGAVLFTFFPAKVFAVGIELFPVISPSGNITLMSDMPPGTVFGYRQFSHEYDGDVYNNPYPYAALGGNSWVGMLGGGLTMEGGFANGGVSTPDGDYWVAVTNQGSQYTPNWNADYYYWRASRVGGVWSPTTLSLIVSTSTQTVSVHDFISPNDIGSQIAFTVTGPEGLVYTSSGGVATTTGDFYYTWQHPTVTDPNTTKPNNYIFSVSVVKDSTVIRQASKTVTLASAIAGYPGYFNFSEDASQQIYDSYSYLIQTLGTGLSGALSQVDIKTSKFNNVYGSSSFLNIYECDTNTYGSPDYSGGGCVSLFTGVSDDQVQIVPSVQSFYMPTPLVLNPSKYYFFHTQGNNQFNLIPKVYGSAADTVDGSCFRLSLGNVFPCDSVADLYFYLRGAVKSSEPVPTGLSNVLFLPGLEASRLYKIKNATCQINCEDQLWEPDLFGDISGLYLDNQGRSLNTVYTEDVIDKGLTFKVYDSLISDLDNLVQTHKINSWIPYAYDWRQDINDIVENGTRYEAGKVSLINTLQALASTSQTGKVTIIAHSNGGLLAKALIKKLQDMKSQGQSDLVDKIGVLILVASPQLGTPDAVSALLHGYKQSIPYKIMTEVEARKLAQNMSSVYGLLPSSAYFNQVNVSSIANFTASPSTLLKNAYGLDVNTYQELHNFVIAQEGRTQPVETDLLSPIKGNALLLSQGENLHDVIDTMVIPSTIQVFTIGGWGKATISGIKYVSGDLEPMTTIRGDETVVMESSMYGSGTKYWLDLSNSKLKHADILEDQQLLSFINSIILKESPTSLFGSEPLQVGNRLHQSVHSPISIGLYDTQGNFTGKVCDDAGNCEIQENIPGSTYLEFGEGKYVYSKEAGIQKTVLQGTGSGTFTYISEKVAPSGQVTTSTFTDIPVTTQTQGEVVLNTITQAPELKLDVTGDGTVDFTLAPTAEFDPITFLQIMKKTIESFDIKAARKTALSKRIDGIIKSIQKGKIAKAQLKAERFQTVLKVKVAKPAPKKPKPQRLTNADAEVLIGMLETLLDNLEK